MRRFFTVFALLLAIQACGDKSDLPAPPVEPTPGPVYVPPDEPDEPVTEPDPPPPPVVSCAEWTTRAYGVLDVYCASCHQAPANRGGMDYVLDAGALRSFGRVTPFDPQGSGLYARMVAGTMPPAGFPAPSSAEVNEVGQWIGCGAQDFPNTTPPTAPPPVAGVEWYENILLMAQDIGTRRLADQINTRYIILSPIGNAAPELLYEQRESIALALNSLSNNRALARPSELGRGGTVLRVDLRDYGWAFDDWELLVAEYPYGIRHDLIPVNSERFDAQVVEADEDLRDFAGTEIAYVNSDWFLGNATRAPLYYDLLGVPATLGELEALLGVNINQDIADELVQRAGFNTSGVSENNRVIERHDLFATGGYLWVSYDFINSAADRNIFADPINFAFDGGEFIWTLNNGLQGYAIADAAGVILDKAPQAVVRHNDRPDAAVEAGISCMGCHHQTGIISKDDVIRDYVEANFAFGAVRDDTIALYPPVREMQAIMQRDGALFTGSRNRAADLVGANQPVLQMVLDHEREMDAERVAASFGISTAEFQGLLNTDSAAFPAEIGGLRGRGGSIKRDAFDRIFAQTVCALGLGEPICRGTAGADGVLGNADDLVCLPCAAFE